MNFNINRFSRLVKRDWLVYQKPIGYAVLATCIFLIGIVYYNVQFNEYDELPMSFWINTFTTFLFVGGGLLTSIIYWEFKDAAGRINYLSIPASHLEKVVSRLLYSFVGYPLLLVIVFFILFKLTELFDGPVYSDMTIGHVSGVAMPFYLIGQPIVFMFAIWINKYVAPKTAIIALLILVIGSIVLALIFRIVLAELFDGWTMSGDFRIEPIPASQARMEEHLWPFVVKFFSGFAMLLFWTVAYFKMKEKQV